MKMRNKSHNHNGSGHENPPGVAGKIFVSLFFSIFFAAGVFFFGLIVRDTARALQTRFWDETPCTILHSEVDVRGGSGNKPNLVKIYYSYEHGGREINLDVYRLDYKGHEKITDAQRIIDEFAPGMKTVCFVNPQKPAQAVLAHRSPWIGLAVFLPLIFIVIGGGGVYFTWFGKNEDRKKKPVSSRAKSSKDSSVVTSIFFGIFFLVGLAALYFLGARPAMQVLAARDWIATPCTIERSRVVSHRSDDGVTYSIDILFRYEAGGETCRSDRYKFAGGASSGSAGKSAVVRRFPVGSEKTCYVDPDDPHKAVIERGFTPDMWFCLLGLPFLGVGVWGMFLRRGGAGGRRSGRRRRGGDRRDPGDVRGGDGVRKLKPKSSPLGGFIGIILAAAFWNGIVSLFVREAVEGFRSGRPSWFMAVFMIPFVLVGVLLIVGVFHQFFALFNPKPRFSLAPGTVIAGEPAAFDFAFTGAAGRIQTLTITLEGAERATYRRGTATVTNSSIFHREVLIETDKVDEMRRGTAGFTIPSPAPPSFKANHNEICWSLKVRGDIRRWPDVSCEFVIDVAAPGAGEEL